MTAFWGQQRFRHLVADDKSLYGITPTGALLWFPRWNTVQEAPRADRGIQIGQGWNDVEHIVTGGDGDIYTVSAEGQLRWLRDLRRDGSNAPDGSTGWAPGSGNVIRTGWKEVTRLIGGGNGLLYTIDAWNRLRFHQYLLRNGGNEAGATGWAPRSGARIGQGWLGNRWVVSGGDGVFYMIDADGQLRWYRDLLQDGTNAPDGSTGWAASGGAVIGQGWQWNTHVFSGGPGEIIVLQSYCACGGFLRVYKDLRRDGQAQWQVIGNVPTQFSDAYYSGGWACSPLEGYAWPLAVDPGEAVDFHVSAAAAGGFVSSVVRLTGRVASGVAVPAAAPAVVPPNFEAGFQAAGASDTDCAWPSAFRFTAPQGDQALVPGFYAGRVSGVNRPPADMPFVVRRGASDGTVALVVNVNCWNAYNAWGGASNYTSQGVPPAGSYTPVSLTFKRPAPHLLTSSQDSINGDGKIRSEIWLLDWLQQRYAVTLLTDIDLHRQPDLSAFKAVVLGTHPEYWTAAAIDALSGYLDRGGSLLYLGGNAAYRPTGLSAQGQPADLDLMQVSNNNWSNDPRGFPTYEGKPLFGCATGSPVSFNDDSPRGAGLTLVPGAPFVPARVRAPVTVGTTGWNPSEADGSDPSPWGAFGCEIDSWTPSEWLADLQVIGSGTSGGHMATYRTAAGGFVLGAGSISFVGALVADEMLQEIVLNALADAHGRPADVSRERP